MKKKFGKRLIAFCMISVLMIGTAVPAFAATASIQENVVAEYTIDASASGFSVMANNTVTGTVASNGTGYAYPHLDSYVGLSKTFHIATSSSGTSGMVLLYLYNEKGKLISNDWIMGVNDGASWKVTLPSSGTYTLKICLQATTAPVTYAAHWY